MITDVVGANGVKLHVRVEGDGPALLLLHGFPDASDVWDELAPHLLADGYRLIIPDLRGFGASDRPVQPNAYALPNAVADVFAVLAATGDRTACVIGHDWGGLIAWHAAATSPQTFPWLVSLSAPHPSAFRQVPLEQRRRSWYVFLFCLYGVAEGALRSDDWQLFRSWAADGGMPAAAVAQRVSDLEKSGALTAALSWYRANLPIPTARPTRIPSLLIHGRDDPFVIEDVLRQTAEYAGPDHQMAVIDAGHWLQQTHPESVAALIRMFADEWSAANDHARSHR